MNNQLYAYAPLANTVSNTLCVGYHLGTSLESGVGHSALTSDADVVTAALLPAVGVETSLGATVVVCNETGATADFHGSDTAGKCRTSPADFGSTCFDVSS